MNKHLDEKMAPKPVVYCAMRKITGSTLKEVDQEYVTIEQAATQVVALRKKWAMNDVPGHYVAWVEAMDENGRFRALFPDEAERSNSVMVALGDFDGPPPGSMYETVCNAHLGRLPTTYAAAKAMLTIYEHECLGKSVALKRRTQAYETIRAEKETNR